MTPENSEVGQDGDSPHCELQKVSETYIHNPNIVISLQRTAAMWQGLGSCHPLSFLSSQWVLGLTSVDGSTGVPDLRLDHVSTPSLKAEQTWTSQMLVSTRL